MPEEKLNLRQKLVKVYEEIDHVEKAGTNTKQNYKFVEAADVLRVVRNAFAKFGIYAETNYDYIAFHEIKTNSGGTMWSAIVKAIIKLYDTESDETKTISGLGDGADGGDKGIYKAQTGATKNALRNGTLLPDKADPEADESVDEQAGRPAQRQTQKMASSTTTDRPTPAPTAQKSSGAKPTTSPSATAMSAPTVASAQPIREPGDDTSAALPTEAELKTYREKFNALGLDLKKAGVKSSPGSPVNRKLLVFVLDTYGVNAAEQLTKANWENFFQRADAARNANTGLKPLAIKVEEANASDKKKK